MCSVYRLNKQGDSRQPCCTPFLILNQSVFPYRVLDCCFLTHIQVSQDTGKMVWYFHLSKSFPQFIMIHTVKGFSVVNKTEIDVFLKFLCFLYNAANFGNLISSSSSFSKHSLDIWKFLVHITLKPSMQDFKYELNSIGDKWNYLMTRTFFSITFLGNWGDDWPFPVLWPLLGSRFSDLLNIHILLELPVTPAARSSFLEKI